MSRSAGRGRRCRRGRCCRGGLESITSPHPSPAGTFEASIIHARHRHVETIAILSVPLASRHLLTPDPANRSYLLTSSLFHPSPPNLADFVQELYLKELKAYKTPAVKESDAHGQVLAFNQPKVPKSPEETDLASSLKEYESMAVEVEGQEGADSKPGATAAVEDWLVLEEEEEKGHAHGH